MLHLETKMTGDLADKSCISFHNIWDNGDVGYLKQIGLVKRLRCMFAIDAFQPGRIADRMNGNHLGVEVGKKGLSDLDN